MAAILLATLVLLFSPPAIDPEYARAIEQAVDSVDPQGKHPEWSSELRRICMRESQCGRYGDVSVHGVDSWAGAPAWLGAYRAGYIDPETCAEHRLNDYTEVMQRLDSEREKASSESQRQRLNRLMERIDELPRGEFETADFSTRGGWGQNAARAVRFVGECAPPTVMDDPDVAALVAAKTIANCRVDGRLCTCSEHVPKWVGAGAFASRSIRSQFHSVQRQCGDVEAWRFVIDRVLVLVHGILVA